MSLVFCTGLQPSIDRVANGSGTSVAADLCLDSLAIVLGQHLVGSASSHL